MLPSVLMLLGFGASGAGSGVTVPLQGWLLLEDGYALLLEYGTFHLLFEGGLRSEVTKYTTTHAATFKTDATVAVYICVDSTSMNALKL